MTDRLVSLGSAFWALMGGAFVSVAIAVYIDTLQGDTLPAEWGILLICAILFCSAGVLWIGLSMSLARLEDALQHVPASLGLSDREQLIAKFREDTIQRARLLLWVGGVTAAFGLALLPARVWLW